MNSTVNQLTNNSGNFSTRMRYWESQLQIEAIKGTYQYMTERRLSPNAVSIKKKGLTHGFCG